jgi:AraC-like DNA-binding protein
MSVIEFARISPERIGEGSGETWNSRIQTCSHGLVVSVAEPAISGDISLFEFAGAKLWAVSSGAQLMRRLRPSAGGSFRPMAILDLKGKMRVKQCGRQCELSPQSFVFIDGSLPHELEFDGNFTQLVLQFPKFAFPSSAYRRAVGLGLDGKDVLNQPFFECVRNVWDAAAALHPLDHATALTAIIALGNLTTVISAAAGKRDTPIRVLRAMEYIEQHLDETSLCPQSIADAQMVSRRYLDALFSQEGHRLQSWIWERRLQRAAQELRLQSNSRFTTPKNLLQVAFDLGFKTPSHFSRAFAKRFGMPPTEYRRTHGMPQPAA